MRPARLRWRLAFCLAIFTAVGMLASGFWIPAKAGLAQILLERAWAATRSGRDDARPWPWADTVPIARLSIPRLNVSWIVLSGASGRNLAFAPAHLDGSALPGEAGVAVIAGHRDTHFERLGELEPGTEILLENGRGEISRYTMTGSEIVDSRTARLRLDADSPVLVLTTCYPFDALTAGGPLRYLVEARALDE
jgi:sortase A